MFEFEGKEAQLSWIAESDGSCTIVIDFGFKTDMLGCSFTAADDVIKLVDDGCEETEGTYGYGIDGDTLTFELISDWCKDRSEAVPGDWTRE